MTYQETPYQKTNIVDANGNIISSFGSSDGSRGDASATKQQSQIDLETQILNAIALLALQFPSALAGDRLKVDGSGVTQPVSATALPLPSNAATDTMLQQVRDAIKAQIAIASTIWTDNSGAFYVLRNLVNQGAGTISVSFTDPSGNAVTPGAGLRPLASTDKDVVTDFYDVITGGTGYSVGNLLASVTVLDVNSGTPTATFVWLNISLNTILLTAPIAANIERANENVGARQVGNWNMGINNFPTSFQVSNFPSGASTAAKQPALGVAGTPSPDVLSFQGIANGIAINTTSSDINTTGNITTVDVLSAIAIGSNNQSIITGNPTANSYISIAANGHNSFLIQASGTWAGTLQFEVSFDGGTTWYSGSAFLVGTGDTVNLTTSNCAVRGNATDATNVRIRAITAITGTAIIRINLSQTIDPITVRNPIRLYDSGSRSQASIKAASTSAVATDTAIVVSECPSAIAPALNNATLIAANTEYSMVITSAKKISFSPISGGSIRYAWVTGKVATPTLPYGSVQVGIEKAEDFLGKAFTGTLYLASATSGTIVVLEQWS